MKLRNKKTGEIGNLKPYNNDKRVSVWIDDVSEPDYIYNSLAELNEEWTDYEEPNVYYYISDFGAIRECEIGKFPEDEEDRKQIGNYFETKEEAEKAVEKLKAFKRLKDKGFRFTGWNGMMTGWGIEYEAGKYYAKWVDDMNLIFEDEE